MATYNIQMKKSNGKAWDTIYPITLASNVKTNDGNDVQHRLDNIFENTATQSSNGALTFKDKLKLDGIEAKANNYIHPINPSTSQLILTAI